MDIMVALLFNFFLCERSDVGYPPATFWLRRSSFCVKSAHKRPGVFVTPGIGIWNAYCPFAMKSQMKS